jgi:hypothetical protein
MSAATNSTPLSMSLEMKATFRASSVGDDEPGLQTLEGRELQS